MAKQQLSLPVQGMTCASCVNHVQKALSKVDGVQDVNVNLATEKASLWFDTDVTLKTLVDTVRETGYDVGTEQVTLDIEGMTCASCVAHVEKALNKVTGVVEANVNLATEKATVTYVRGVASLADFRTAVSDAGYAIKERDAGPEGAEPSAMADTVAEEAEAKNGRSPVAHARCLDIHRHHYGVDDPGDVLRRHVAQSHDF